MKIHAVSRSYKGKTVLKAEEMTFSSGKIYALIGPNGSGKTTFLKLLAGVLTPDEKGPVWEDGEHRIGYLPQKAYPFALSVRNNLFLSVKKDVGTERRADMLIERLGLEEVKKQKANRLSGGEAGKMALARVLMNDVDILLLDEPMAALDIRSVPVVEELVLDYRKRTDAAVFVVTHSIRQAERIADEVLFFCDGRIEERGDAQQVLAHPGSAQLAQFLEYNAG